MQAALYRADRFANCLGHFGDGQLFDKSQEEDIARRLVERANRFDQPRELFGSFDRRIWGRPVIDCFRCRDKSCESTCSPSPLPT